MQEKIEYELNGVMYEAHPELTYNDCSGCAMEGEDYFCTIDPHFMSSICHEQKIIWKKKEEVMKSVYNQQLVEQILDIVKYYTSLGLDPSLDDYINYITLKVELILRDGNYEEFKKFVELSKKY